MQQPTELEKTLSILPENEDPTQPTQNNGSSNKQCVNNHNATTLEWIVAKDH